VPAPPGSWLDEAQAIAEARSEPGLAVTRADVLRMAMRRGLDALAEQAAALKKATGRRKPAGPS
jgi:hypothetical protein